MNERQLWLKLNSWDEKVVKNAVELGFNGIYLPSSEMELVRPREGLTIISDNPRSDLVMGQAICEVLLEKRSHRTAVARHHGVIPTIVYCPDWKMFNFRELLELSGSLIQHAMTAEDAENGLSALRAGGLGILLESTDSETIREVAVRFRTVTDPRP